MSFGGSSNPCAQVAASSIGNLGLEENKRISKALDPDSWKVLLIGLKSDQRDNKYIIQVLLNSSLIELQINVSIITSHNTNHCRF